MRLSRRDYLIGCGQAAAITLAQRDAISFPSGAEYHLHPAYREHTTLEPVLRNKVAGLDNFLLEKDHDQIAVILANWSENLGQPRHRTRAIEQSLLAGFKGDSFQPSGTKLIREGVVDVRRISFGRQALTEPAFIQALRSYLDDFAQILTAEFQVTAIESRTEGLFTQVRYELVGTGTGFCREQRAGNWQLQWRNTDSGGYRLQEWRNTDETRSRSVHAVFADVSAEAFAGNESYAAQLVHGVDYWRTVLDGASRIDIYGHNGVAVGDIDSDGFDDLYICQPAGLPNRLYRNQGDGSFEDITDLSGVGVLENTACALFADFSNSGRQDLLVVRANGPLLFENDGYGRFHPKPNAFKFASEPQGTFTGAAIADYDRDGWLDIYFCLYVYYQGADQYKYPTPYYDANNGPPNFLLRNNRDGTFSDATAQAGLSQNNTRYSFCCGWTDVDNDGWPDLYVANDFGRKNLYRNNGDGTFTDIAAQSGTEDVGAGMSVCCFDYDNDGAEDLYVADMWTAAGERITAQETFLANSPGSVRAMYRKHAMGNALLHNKGSKAFEDTTAAAGVGIGRWSWSSDAWDFDHDGFPDLYVMNGMISGPVKEDLNSFFWRQVVANSPDNPKPAHAYEQGWNAINELIREDYSWSGFERNIFYANNRDGTFSDVSGALGLDFIEDGRAFALADLDRDGRVEVILKNRNAPQLRLLKNVIRELPASVSFVLRGTKSNRDAIGAAINIQTSAGQQTRRLQAGSGFLSQHSKELFFGLGEAKGPVKASIRWPSGLEQPIGEVPANHRVYVEEGSPKFRAEPYRSVGQSTKETPLWPPEILPQTVETWLLAPVPAPEVSFRSSDGTTASLASLRGNPVLLNLSASESKSQTNRPAPLNVLTVDVTAPEQADTAAIYNILYRSLFDRHRDLSLSTSMLIDAKGDIVKIYQGPLDLDPVARDARQIPTSTAGRIARALPFPANGPPFEFSRNYLSLAAVYFQRGYFEQSENWFRSALRDDPESAEAQYGLGSVYLKQSKTLQARASFEQTVKLNASYPDTKPNAWNNLGLIATQEGRTDDAIGFFAEALRLNPDHLISLLNLGNAYRQQKHWDEARRILEDALKIGPGDAEVNYSLAMVFAQTDQPDRAYTLLQKALVLRPDYAEAMNNLGVLYLRTHRRDDAVAEFETCIRGAPAFDQAYLNLARVYVIEGDREKARLTLLALLKEHPNHPQAVLALQEIK